MIRILALLALLAVHVGASAHTRSTSYGHWQIDGNAVHLDLRVAALDMSRFGAGYASPDEAARRSLNQLGERFAVTTPAGPCERLDSNAAAAGADGWIHLSLHWRCPGDMGLRLSALPFHDVAPAHAHIARIRQGEALARTAVLTRRNPVVDLRDSRPHGGFFRLGIEHILSGWDHLAFIAALALAATRLLTLIALLSGFTVAHSLSLAAATLGWVIARETWVEAVIAFSILLVAAQWLWQQGQQPRIWAAGLSLLPLLLWLAGATLPLLGALGLGLTAACLAALGRADRPGLVVAITLAFGLLHGLGFAGALAESAGAQGISLGALLLFNLGVEAGQIGVVILLWPLLRQAPALRMPLAALLIALGLYWFLQRSLLI